MLGPIVEAVVRCRDAAVTAAFYQAAFDLEVLAREGDALVTGVANSDTGRIRLVPTREGEANGEAAPHVWDTGPRLLGIYSRGLEKTCARVAAAGGHTLPIASYGYGTAALREVVAAGPDELYWTIPEVGEAAHRPSPALGDPARLHGELHSAVLVAADHDATLAFFSGAGLDTIFDGTFSGEPFVAMTGMPAQATLRLSFLAAAGQAPARLEIMSFTGVAARDLTAYPVGLRGLLFGCDDVAATRTALIGLGATPLPDGALRGPDGIELTLRGDR